MRVFSELVFDELLLGVNTWYTSVAHYDLLGRVDFLAIQACTRGTAGTTPKLTIQCEHSDDGQNWVNMNGTNPEIAPAAQIQNDASYFGTPYAAGFAGLAQIPQSLVRLRISLTGTNPQCFLKLYVTGRSRAG